MRDNCNNTTLSPLEAAIDKIMQEQWLKSHERGWEDFGPGAFVQCLEALSKTRLKTKRIRQDKKQLEEERAEWARYKEAFSDYVFGRRASCPRPPKSRARSISG